MAIAYAERREMTRRWLPNRNAVRHQPRVSLGPISHTVTVFLIVLLVGLIYLTQSTRVTNYDFALAHVDGEISDLVAERDALAVENAKIKATASAAHNQVAAAMAEARTADFVGE